MSPWRLEWLRLTRTARGWLVLGVFVLFGALGPLTARYLPDILSSSLPGDVIIELPEPTPTEALVQYIGNISQLGILVVVIVAAGALAIDARPEWGMFLRTRVGHVRDLIIPRYLSSVALTLGSFLVGTVIAVAITAAILGSLPVGDVVVGSLLAGLYFAFALAVVVAAAGMFRRTLGIVLGSLGGLVLLPIGEVIPVVRDWLPSTLLAALIELTEGRTADDFLEPAIAALVLTPALVWLGIRRLEGRET